MAYEKLRYDRILSAHRQGNGSKLQMFGGQTGSPLSDPGENDIAIYDANGNVVSSGQTIADISPRVRVAKAGSLIGTRSRLNLIEGSNVTLTVSDDAGNDEIDCTIASTSGGSGSSSVTVGAIADLPASPDASGEIYFCTDSLYQFVGSGSPLGWQAFHGPWPVTPPPSASWSWDNQESGTIDSTYGYEYLYLPRSGLAHVSLRYRTAPSTPYFITAGVLWNINAIPPGSTLSNRDVRLGLFFRDGTGELISYLVGMDGGTFNYETRSWTNSTTGPSGTHAVSGGANQAILCMMGQKSPLWIGIADDGSTNLTFYWSIDKQHWHLFDTWARTAILGSGPTQVGFGGYNGDSPQWQALIHWEEGTSIP